MSKEKEKYAKRNKPSVQALWNFKQIKEI